MKQAVLDIFPSWSAQFEGRVHWMYLDIKGLVTTGVGNLIDPEPSAQSLHWKHPDGSLATPFEIQSEWTVIKSHHELAHEGFRAAGVIAKLRIDDQQIDDLILYHLQQDEKFMLRTLKDFESWPADSQLATCSMAWACGAGFTAKFQHWLACALKQDWNGCATNCEMNATHNPGLKPRNNANFALFTAAAHINEPDAVHWKTP